jgi:hypothetical protein
MFFGVFSALAAVGVGVFFCCKIDKLDAMPGPSGVWGRPWTRGGQVGSLRIAAGEHGVVSLPYWIIWTIFAVVVNANPLSVLLFTISTSRTRLIHRQPNIPAEPLMRDG